MDRATTVELPNSVKLRAGKCAYGFCCAVTGKCGDKKRCAVQYSFGGDALLLATREPLDCPYHLSFGEAQVCTCPVSQYLHNTGIGLGD